VGPQRHGGELAGIALCLVLSSASESGRGDDRKADEASFVLEKIVDECSFL
jgi:hypothetical protein